MNRRSHRAHDPRYTRLSSRRLIRSKTNSVITCIVSIRHHTDTIRGEYVVAIRRMIIREAAEHFGISQDGVRQRIRRGTLESEKDQDGRVYVWVDAAIREPDNVSVQRTEIEEELRERIVSLERQLERRDEELQRAHQLLGESLSQLRALNAPAESHEDSEEAAHQATQEKPEPSTGPTEAEPSASVQRPWWRRLFGG